MSTISQKDSKGVKGETIAELKPEGQIPCVLVYSDKKHVTYIFNIVNCIEEMLPDLGFKVYKLSSESPADTHFGQYFEELADECVLGIVILDGFRPNILFEYGLLRGKGKLVIPIQDKRAKIAIKSLFSIDNPSDENLIKNITGLTKTQFSKLKEPSIGNFAKLSDRHGINVIKVDCDAELNSDTHPKQKIKTEIQKLMPQIRKKYASQALTKIKEKTPKYLEKFQKITLRILRYYTRATPFENSDVEQVISKITELEAESGVKMPSSTYNIISSLLESLAEKELKRGEISKTILIYRHAIELYNRSQKSGDKLQVANTQFRMGTAYYSLSKVVDTKENIRKAIKAYEEALTVYTKEAFPMDYAMAQNNLGNAYRSLSGVRDIEENIRKAIKAFEETLTVYTKEAFPMDYATTQNNLGNAYRSLSEVRNTEENIRKAIKAYEKGLKILTKDKYPIPYGIIKHNLELAKKSM